MPQCKWFTVTCSLSFRFESSRCVAAVFGSTLIVGKHMVCLCGKWREQARTRRPVERRIRHATDNGQAMQGSCARNGHGERFASPDPQAGDRAGRGALRDRRLVPGARSAPRSRASRVFRVGAEANFWRRSPLCLSPFGNMFCRC